MVTPNFTALFNPVKNVPKITEREIRSGFNRMTRPNPSMLGGAADIPMGLLQMLGAPAVGLEEGLVRDPTVDAAVSMGADRDIAGAVVDTGLLAAGFLIPLMSQRSAIKAGSLAELAIKERGMTGYHAGPHRFEPTDRNPLGEFKDEAIGSGEGAQYKGYGHYIAEEKETAKTYRPSPIHRERESSFPGVPGARVSKSELADRLKSGKSLDELGIEEIQRGHLYEVDVPDDVIDTMHDLDRNISDQPAIQKIADEVLDIKISKSDDVFSNLPKELREGINKNFNTLQVPAGKTAYKAELLLGDRSVTAYGGTASEARKNIRIKGDDFRHHLETTLGPKEASQFLLDRGVRGNKFLDQGSRAGGKGTRNWVVFDPNDIKILSRE